MDIIKKSEAHWKGGIKEGSGTIKLGSGAFEGPYGFKSRMSSESSETNPEELIGAAHAGCFSMALSGLLTKAGHPPTDIFTTAGVHLATEGDGFVISQIDLETSAIVPGLSEEEFLKYADIAKKTCPISKALAAVKIEFKANLK